jgi:hypothetical protein
MAVNYEIFYSINVLSLRDIYANDILSNCLALMSTKAIVVPSYQ